jgi:hypothetical protein
MITIYKMNNFECDLCKQPYPLSYMKNNKKIVLFDIPRPTGNYIILEQRETN